MDSKPQKTYIKGTKLLRRAEQASLLQFELVELSLSVHLDDEGNEEHEAGGAEYPGCISGALEEFVDNEGGVGRGLLASVHDGGIRHGGGDA